MQYLRPRKPLAHAVPSARVAPFAPDARAAGHAATPRRAACRRVASLLLWAAIAATPFTARAAETLTLGLISSSTPEATKAAWQPLADALSRAMNAPVAMVSSKNYAEITQSMKSGAVQVAWVNNRMAIELVESGNALVFAQMVRSDGTRGYKSILLARKDLPVKTLDDVMSRPGAFTLAIGDKKSTSGYLVPNYFIFAKRKVDPARHFKAITSGSHRENFNTLAAGKADLAINNTEEVPRYQTEQAADWAKVQVIWESPLIPNDPIVMRKDLPGATQDRLRRFFATYGQGSSAEKATLKAINGLSGFGASGDHQLRPIVDLEMFEAMTRLMNDPSKSPEQVTAAMGELSRRAAKLDTAMSASRYLGQ